MAQAEKSPWTRRKPTDAKAEERKELLHFMVTTRQKISDAYAGFNETRDPDLIEAYVYEINALQSRYSYLLRQVRELETPAVTQR